MSLENLPFAVAVVGPTAVGKTKTAMALCRRTGGEIVSCDSMQIYREMSIGTAKPTPEERAAVPHHLVDFLPPNTPYSAADYAADAEKAAKEILSRGKLPVFCGGTGLYLEAVRTGRHDEMPDVRDDAYRTELLKIAETEDGKRALYEKLCDVDRTTAEKTHENNLRRVIRALEIYKSTGIPKSEWDERSKTVMPRFLMPVFLLDCRDRALLYRRIDERVNEMMTAGLYAETARLYESGVLNPENTAAQAIGYKEILPAVRGEIPLAEATENLKRATRRYAKRQLTWFRAIKGIHTLYLDNEDATIRMPDELAGEMLSILQSEYSGKFPALK